jgi:hypothetical protein
MRLPPRLAWRRWRLRNEPVPRDGRPLSAREMSELDAAHLALADKEGTRRVALDEEGAEILASAGNEGEFW